MTKENILRVTCDRCPHQEDLAGGLFARYPQEWKKIEGVHLCAKCVREYKIVFNRFMHEGKKG